MSDLIEYLRNQAIFGEIKSAPAEANPTASIMIAVEEGGRIKRIPLAALATLLGGDMTPPAVSLTASQTAISGTGTVTFTATATDAAGIARVDFYRNGVFFASDNAAPYSAIENYTAPQQGTYTYTAVAFDLAGNSSTSAPVSVTVNIQPAADQTPPVVALVVSATGLTSPGVLTLSATASDNVGVDRVEFMRDGVLFATDSSAPYSATQALDYADNGSIVYTARAFDAAGNYADSNQTVLVAIPQQATLDVATAADYHAAIGSAAFGNKRSAGAGAIRTALAPAYRLRVYCDDALKASASYSGELTVGEEDGDVYLQIGQVTAATLEAAVATTGTWRFEVQGGPGFGRSISGPIGTGVLLSGDTAPAYGLATPIRLNVPRAIDAL